jgi:aspartyl-tRNA(Asn)/glutamyl-tRNA(Gln) amidotransferase subunit C
MSLSNEQVRHLAHLARLAISDAAVDTTRRQLDDIFALIARMRAIDTTGIDPMSHPQDLAARLRPDEITETDRRATFQAIAPRAEAGLYLVPKVIE